jgi:hypothetical protein
MKGAVEVQDLGAALAAPGRQVLAHLPVHRRLDRVVDRRTAARDKEHIPKVAAEGRLAEGAYERLQLLGVDVAIGELVASDPFELLLEEWFTQTGVVETQRLGTKKSEKIEEFLACMRVDEEISAALLDVVHERQPLRQEPATEVLVHPRAVHARCP